MFKQKVQLLFTFDEMLTAFEEGVALADGDWNELRNALFAFGLPRENIMFDLIDDICNDTSDLNAFTELRKYFDRFFDAQQIAAADSLKVSETHTDKKYGCNREFMNYEIMLRNIDQESLESHVLDNLKAVREQDPEYYELLTSQAKEIYFEGNKLEGINGSNNSVIKNRVLTLKNNVDRLVWLYNNLSDHLSRCTLNALIKFYLTFDLSGITKIASYTIPDVNPAIFPFYDDEVFVDCGSYIGDTIIKYVNRANFNYKRIYAYEISKKSIKEIEKTLKKLPNVVINHKGTGDKNTRMNLVGLDESNQANALSETDVNPITQRPEFKPQEMVEVVRLDYDISEPVNHIKIDVEGMDKETLRGANGLIKKYHPKLHVDSYHKLEDLIEIPWLIREIDPSYTLYMRIFSQYPFSNPINPSITFQAI